MDIKERIDKLSETEAKAALKYTFTELQKTMVCPKCKIRVECERTNKLCESVLLEAALKETRK